MRTPKRHYGKTRIERHDIAYQEGVDFCATGQEYKNKYTLSDMLEYHSFHAGYCDAVRGYV